MTTRTRRKAIAQARARELRARGLSLSAIARELNCTDTWVRELLAPEREPEPKPAPAFPGLSEAESRAFAAFRAGESLEVVAAALGVSEQEAGAWCDRVHLGNAARFPKRVQLPSGAVARGNPASFPIDVTFNGCVYRGCPAKG
jgi:hypothetical protein